jgi:hypothetical protein
MKIKDIKKFFKERNWELDKESSEEGYSLYFRKRCEEMEEENYLTAFILLEEGSDDIQRIEFESPRIYDDYGYLCLEEERLCLLHKVIQIIESDAITLKKNILRNYLEAIERFEKIYLPALIDLNLGYMPSEDQLISPGFDVTTIFSYHFIYQVKGCAASGINFYYDYVEDTIYFDRDKELFVLTPEEFQEEVILILKNDRRTEYLISNDPKHTKNTYYQVCLLLDLIDMYNKGKCPKMDVIKLLDLENNIPEKYQNILITYELAKEQYEKNSKTN